MINYVKCMNKFAVNCRETCFDFEWNFRHGNNKQNIDLIIFVIKISPKKSVAIFALNVIPQTPMRVKS